MTEARDRLSWQVDYATRFFNRRQNGILLDVPDNLFVSLPQRLPSGTVGNVGPVRGSVVHRGPRGRHARDNFGIGRSGRRIGLSQRRANSLIGAVRRRIGRSATSVLHSSYPRTPLRDITAVVRTTERRRACVGEDVDREIETPQQIRVLNSPIPLSDGQLEHTNGSMVTPAPAMGLRSALAHFPQQKVQKMLRDITKENHGETEFLTAQRKLLNSIDKIEKVVMEELHKLKSTPNAEGIP